MDLSSTARLEYAYHVEASLLEVRVLGQVSFGEGPDDRLLARGYGLQRVAEPRSPAQLHLDEHEGLSGAQDQVYLPVPGPMVPLDEDVTFCDEMFEGEPLAPIPGPLPAQTPTPA